MKKLICLIISLCLCSTIFFGCMMEDSPSSEKESQSKVEDLSEESLDKESLSEEQSVEESQEDLSEESNEEEGNLEVGYWHDTFNFGITVDDGVMMLGDEALYEAGVNCYNLVNQCFEDNFSSQKAKQTLDVLADYGISVVRFNCGGYAYDSIATYLENEDEFIQLLVEVCEYAEELQIGLIPSFFWLHHAVPDYFDEPIRYWGREDSQTIGFVREYTSTIVSYVKDYKAVFAWEFGNEFNLSCDLPNASEHMPALPEGSKRASRTEEDYLSATDFNFAISVFVEEILKLDDTGRMITTGNATLRPSQYNQLYFNSWEQDSVEQFRDISIVFNPEGVTAVCEHVYFTSQHTFGQDLTLAEYLTYAVENAKSLEKAYFVGEWGGGTSNERSYYSEIGKAFIDAGVQLALLWNFNAVEGSVEYSFSANTERGQMLLDVIEEMNNYYDEKYTN